MSSSLFRLSSLITILLCTISFSQNPEDTIVSKEIKEMYHKFLKDTDAVYQNGEKILEIAESSLEYLYGYNLMADALYKKNEYSDALYYYKKIDSLSERLNNADRKFFSNFFMTNIYQRVGLLIHAKETYNEMVRISPKIDHTDACYMMLQSESAFLEDTYNYCEAIQKRDEKLRLVKDIFTKDSTVTYVRHLVFGSYNRLAYVYLKCDEYDKASENIKKSEVIIRDIPLNTIDLVYEYYMNKAIFAAENHKVSEAKFWFDKALSNAEKSNIQIGVMKVLEQRLNYDIDDWETKKTLVKKYNILKQKKKKEASKIIALEEKQKNETIKRKEYYIILITGISVILVICTFSLVRYYYKQKKKKLRIQFEKIIHQLNDKNVNNGSASLKINAEEIKIPNEVESDKIHFQDRIMSKEKESELFEKLIEFENGHDFLENSFTISTMTNLMDTNPKYLNRNPPEME